MNTRGKAVLASLASAPKGNVQVAPPDAKAGGYAYGFRPRPEWEGTFMDNVAANLTKWANGDLSFLAGQMPVTGTPVRPDKDKRKRDAMADVLDGKK